MCKYAISGLFTLRLFSCSRDILGGTSLLKFRKWFKYGLKAQKLLAQGIALGIIAINKAPCKGKSFMCCLEF